jgi:hypothetical protein
MQPGNESEGTRVMKDQDLKYPEWQIALQEVILESDLDKLPGKIQRLETLIFQRLQALRSSNNGADEREAISDAVEILRTVKKERLGFPDWK